MGQRHADDIKLLLRCLTKASACDARYDIATHQEWMLGHKLESKNLGKLQRKYFEQISRFRSRILRLVERQRSELQWYRTYNERPDK